MLGLKVNFSPPSLGETRWFATISKTHIKKLSFLWKLCNDNVFYVFLLPPLIKNAFGNQLNSDARFSLYLYSSTGECNFSFCLSFIFSFLFISLEFKCCPNEHNEHLRSHFLAWLQQNYSLSNKNSTFPNEKMSDEKIYSF